MDLLSLLILIAVVLGFGFSLLHKDIKEELSAIARFKQGRKLNVQESRREAKLLADLDFVQNHILKEISDIKPVS